MNILFFVVMKTEAIALMEAASFLSAFFAGEKIQRTAGIAPENFIWNF